MPTLQLFCDRPHVSKVDFGASRFVVSTAVGLNVNGTHLELGDEVPQGALSEYALRLEYEPPLRRIDLVEYAKNDPSLREDCARRGVILEETPKATLGGATPLAPTLTTTNPSGDRPSDPQVGKISTVATNARHKAERLRLDALPRSALVKACKKANLSTDGTREDLCARLLALVG